MKKIVVITLISLAFSIGSYGQSSQRQKAVHMAAVRIAEQIQVPSDKKEAFISMYQDFKKESVAVMALQPAAAEGEAAVEAKILSDFDKSERILQIRRDYYQKFRTILTPSQIQKMYDAERAAAGGRN